MVATVLLRHLIRVTLVQAGCTCLFKELWGRRETKGWPLRVFKTRLLRQAQSFGQERGIHGRPSKKCLRIPIFSRQATQPGNGDTAGILPTWHWQATWGALSVTGGSATSDEPAWVSPEAVSL